MKMLDIKIFGKRIKERRTTYFSNKEPIGTAQLIR